MKKALMTFGSAILITSSSLTLGAQGPYVGLNLGAAIPNDSDVTDPTFPNITLDIEANTGLALGAAVGYVFANNLRGEVELAYQNNDLDKIGLSGVSVDLDGDISSLGLLFNGYYEIVNSSGFLFNVGAGLGFMNVSLNDLNIPRSGIPDFDDDDTVFAYQVGVGIGYAVNPKLAIDLKYRYMGTDDPSFDGTEVEYSTNNIYVGVRFGF